jgi:hypothetical protein
MRPHHGHEHIGASEKRFEEPFSERWFDRRSRERRGTAPSVKK